MNRLRALGTLVLVLVFEAAALGALRHASRIERWRVDWSNLGRWMDVTPSSDVVAGLVVWLGLAVALWIAFSLGLSVVASVVRVPLLVRTADVFSFPGIQRMVTRSLGVGIALQAVLPHAAFAQPPAGGWVTTPVTASPTPSLGDAVTGQAVAVAPTAAAVGQWGVASGDNLWEIAAETLAHNTGRAVAAVPDEEVATYWQQVMAGANPASGDPNLIYPDEVYVLPVLAGTVQTAPTPVAAPEPIPASVPTPAAATPPATVAEATVAAPAPTVATTVAAAPVDALPADAVEPAQAPTPATGVPPVTAATTRSAGSGSFVIAGLLGTGLVALLARRRRRRGRSRDAGEELVEAAPEAQAIEHAAVRVADEDGVAFVQAGLRLLAASVDTTNEIAPPIGVIIGEEGIDVVMAEAGVAPPPFRGRGTHWTLTRATAVPSDPSMPMPLPALVSLGTTHEGQEVLVDLEDPGMLSLVGAGAEEIVLAAGHQLATAPWANLVSVIFVGAPGPDLPNVTSVDSLDDVLARLEREALETAGLLTEVGCDSVYEARLQMVAPDTWVPTVVVCVAPPAEHLARRLVGLVSSAEAHGVSALVAGHVPDGPWEMVISHDGIVVEALGVTVAVPQRMSTSDAHLVNELLESAAHAPMPVVAAGAEAADVDTDAEPGAEIIVSLYGPLSVEGLAGTSRLTPAKVLELFVYVVCHRGAALDNDRLIGALWPDDDVASKGPTLNNYTYLLRQALGASSTGEAHFPTVGNSRAYSVGRFVASSVELLERALTASNHLEAAEAKKRLRVALGRVYGRPFDTTSRAAYDWARAENHERHAMRVAVDAAHRLCVLAMETPAAVGAGADLTTAEWAIAQGQIVDPDSELLRADEMRVAHARQDWPARDAAWAAVDRAAQRDGDEPGPVVAAVYDALLLEEDLLERVG